MSDLVFAIPVRILHSMELKLDIVEESAHALVDVLQAENDIVRIVDPATRAVVYWPAVERGELDSPA